MKSKKRSRRDGVSSSTETSPASSRSALLSSGVRQHMLAAVALCLLAFLAYSNSFSTGFPLDNKPLILDDSRVHEATSANVDLIVKHSYWWPFGEAGLYRPLTTLSYLFNYAILGNRDHPEGYHWLNFALHAAAIVLLYAVVFAVTKQFWPTLLISALWSVHPASTESVTNIIGRSDVLAAIGILAGFLLYLKSTEQAGARRIGLLAGLMAVTAIGVFSKESAISIIGVIVVYELMWWKERRQVAGLAWASLAVLPPVVFMLISRSAVFAGARPAEFPFTDNPIAGASFWTGRLTAVRLIAHYLVQTVWPMRLSADYSYAQVPLATGTLEDWIAWVIVAAVASALYFVWRSNRTAFFFAAFAAITFLPTANLLFPVGTIRADRFLYLPSAGLLACIVLCARAALQNRRAQLIGSIALGVIIAVFAIRTWIRNSDWQDDLTLATADTHSSPHSFKAHFRRAAALLQGDSSYAKIDQAVDEVNRSVAILDPLPDVKNAPNVYQLAGEAYLIKGDLLRKSGSGEAVAAYQTARLNLAKSIRIANEYLDQLRSEHADSSQGVIPRPLPVAYRDLSALDLRLGNIGEALTSAEKAQVLAPFDPDVYRQLAEVFLAQQRGDDAVIALMKGMLITSDPGIRSDLMRFFASNRDPGNCTLMSGPNGPAINPQCPTIRELVCAASSDVLKARLASGQREQAKKEKQDFLRNYGCPAAPLDNLLPDH